MDTNSAAAARGNLVLMTMFANLIVKEAERHFHLTLSTDEAMDLLTLGLVSWHAGVTSIKAFMLMYFPPPPAPKP